MSVKETAEKYVRCPSLTPPGRFQANRLPKAVAYGIVCREGTNYGFPFFLYPVRSLNFFLFCRMGCEASSSSV